MAFAADLSPSALLWIAAASGYLLGAVPFGLVLVRLAGHGDIRKIGSGNIGATNVLRTGNRPLALATLVLDGGKGAAAALVAGALLNPEAGLVAAVAAVVGHNFPVWLNFRGGKGVATTLGALIAVAWPIGLAACATWGAVAAATRYSSASALAALTLAPIYAWAWSSREVAVAAAVLGLLAWMRHRSNVERLIAGTEPKIGRRSGEDGEV